MARVQVRYPEVPIVLLETRALAEEWAYRWLGAACVEPRESTVAIGTALVSRIGQRRDLAGPHDVGVDPDPSAQ